tara:strand:+ start:18751 stop:19437 length:687 start_codon:yes stop_codon:yes gene_type:complete
MASIDSIYTDPSDTFAWYIDGNRIAIVTSKGDANTTETGEGKYKAVQLGTTQSYQNDDTTKNLINENPFAAADTTLTVDDGTNISVNDMLKLDSEIVLVTAKSTNNLTVTRGYRDTTDAAHVNDTEIHTVNYVSGGILVSYHAEPDKLSSITGTIDIENELQPALIDYVKGKALMDAAAITNDPNIAQIKMIAGQQALASYRESLRKFGMKKNDKVGGTRAVVPANLT